MTNSTPPPSEDHVAEVTQADIDLASWIIRRDGDLQHMRSTVELLLARYRLAATAGVAAEVNTGESRNCLNSVAAENVRLRIGWWNYMKQRGVTDDHAYKAFDDARAAIKGAGV